MEPVNQGTQQLFHPNPAVHHPASCDAVFLCLSVCLLICFSQCICVMLINNLHFSVLLFVHLKYCKVGKSEVLIIIITIQKPIKPCSQKFSLQTEVSNMIELKYCAGAFFTWSFPKVLL